MLGGWLLPQTLCIVWWRALSYTRAVGKITSCTYTSLKKQGLLKMKSILFQIFFFFLIKRGLQSAFCSDSQMLVAFCFSSRVMKFKHLRFLSSEQHLRISNFVCLDTKQLIFQPVFLQIVLCSCVRLTFLLFITWQVPLVSRRSVQSFAFLQQVPLFIKNWTLAFPHKEPD